MSTGKYSAAAGHRSEPGADMCGIAGCYQQPDGHKLVDTMTERIAHRGPDSSGTWNHEDDRKDPGLSKLSDP